MITLDHNTLIAIIVVAIISLICCMIFCCARSFWKHSKHRFEMEQNRCHQPSKLNIKSTSHDIHDIHDEEAMRMAMKRNRDCDLDQERDYIHKWHQREKSPSMSHSSYTNSNEELHGNHILIQSDLNRKSEPIPSQIRNGNKNKKRRSLQNSRDKDKKLKKIKKSKSKHHQSSTNPTSTTTHYQNVQTRPSKHKRSLPTIVDRINTKRSRTLTDPYNPNSSKPSQEYNNINIKHRYTPSYHR